VHVTRGLLLPIKKKIVSNKPMHSHDVSASQSSQSVLIVSHGTKASNVYIELGNHNLTVFNGITY